MAKTKADWLKEAEALGLKMTTKDKIADIKAAIEEAAPKKHDKAASEKAIEEKEQVAKAGKRSAKAVRAAEEEDAKKERVEEEKSEDAHEEKKGPVPVTRPLIERRSKRYQEAAKHIEKDKLYSVKDAVSLAVKTSKVKFDPTLEVHVALNVDPKQANQNIRGVVVLPHGTGKKIRIAVFAAADDQKKAKEAGADIVGEEDFIEQLKKEQLDFDVLVSTPQMMAQLGQFARVLGPKGLMPNPKSGTVTKDVAKAVKQLKAGQLEYRVDEQGIVHSGAGKISFGEAKLTENADTLLTSIKNSKPSSVKGAFIEKIYMTTTMGPSIPIDQNTL
jgi:large subunit ribosomal protein L1